MYDSKETFATYAFPVLDHMLDAELRIPVPLSQEGYENLVSQIESFLRMAKPGLVKKPSVAAKPQEARP